MLSIQKVVVLLDEFHLKEFRKYLEESKAELPLKLVDAAKKLIPRIREEDEKDSDDLCKIIYKKAGVQEKKKFFQLAHHTFKLTGYLSRNYPSYLLHNISKIEHFVNQGKLRRRIRLRKYCWMQRKRSRTSPLRAVCCNSLRNTRTCARKKRKPYVFSKGMQP